MAEPSASIDLTHEFVQSADTPVPGRPRWAVVDHVVNVFGWLHRRGPLSSSYWSLYKVLDDGTSRLVLWTGIILAITAGIPLPLMAVVFRSVIDSFPPSEDQVIRAISQIIGIACAYFIVTFGWTVCWGVVGGRISVRLQQRLLRRVIGMDMSFFDSHSSKISSVLAADTQTVQRGTSEKVGLFIQSMSYFGATFVTAFVLSPALTGVLFAVVVPTILFLVTFGSSWVSKFAKEATKLSDEATAIAENAIHSVKVVQAFDALSVLSDEHTRILRQSTRYAYRKSVMGAMMLAAVYFLCYAVNALAFYVGSRFGGSSGTIYAVVFLILDASFVFNQVGPFLQNLAMAASAGSRIMEIIQCPSAPIDVYSEKGLTVDSNVLSGDLEFKNVSFSYPSSPATPVLHSINVKLEPGSFTGVVGLSGSGKSTLASLLLRFYDPTDGEVLFSGTNVKDLHLKSFRSHVGLVDQNHVLFSGTILDNIKIGIPNADDLSEEEVLERCAEAARTANADFITDLHDGIYTRVSNNTGLSGGQQQRICLARAIVRDPSILILDEPTSALDSYSESKILEALNNLSKHGRTILMIAHRLATVRSASKIVVMDRGTIVEHGTHDTLMDNCKLYKSLVQAQSMARPTMTTESSIADLREEKTIQVSDLRRSESRASKRSRRGSNLKPLEERRTTSFIMRCLSINKPESLLIIIALLASAVCGCLIVGESVVFGHLISTLNTVTDAAKLQHDVDFLSLMFFVVSLVALVGYGTSGSCFGLMSETFLMRIRDASLRTILKQDQAWFQDPDHSPTKLVAAMVADANNVSGLSGVIVGAALSLAVNMVSGFTTSIVSAWKISLVLFTFFPAIIVAGYLRVKMLTMFERHHTEDYKQAASMASEACLNVRTVAAYGKEAEVLRDYSIAVTRPYEESFRYNVFGNFALAFSYSIIFFVYPLAYWWGSRLVRNGEYSQLDFFITLPSYLITAQQSGQFFTMAPEVTAARAAAIRIFKLLDQTPTIMRDAQPYQPTNFLELEKETISNEKQSCDSASTASTSRSASQSRNKGQQGARVEFQRVCLKYENKPNVSILKNIDLTIEPGQLVGLVGPSGAGKSSIIALLERFFDPISGRVFIDGIDIKSTPVSQHRAKISIVPQEADMFTGSVAFNISLGAAPGDRPSRARIEEVCKSCGVHDFISSLSEGYDTEVGPRGSRLSGGQRQRVAIARAILRDPQILLLDEATSALDSQNEREIQKAILAARQNRTTIIVAHRLSTVAEADTIFVFDKGRLVDRGTHTDLLAREGLYATMAQAQMVD